MLSGLHSAENVSNITTFFFFIINIKIFRIANGSLRHIGVNEKGNCLCFRNMQDA